MKSLDKTEAEISAIKSLMGAVPFAGTLLTEVFFDYRSRVKQKRFENFIEELSKSIKDIDSEKIDMNYIKTDEFGDILEEIIKRAVSTNSEDKRKRFKKILIGEMSASTTSEYKMSFLDMTSYLSEIQIIILKEHSTIGKSIGRYYRDIEDLNNQIPELEKSLQNEKRLGKKGYANSASLFETRLKLSRKDIASKTKALKQSEPKRSCNHYGISQEDYIIHIQDLVSKGLMIDLGTILSNYSTFQILEITSYGKEFLKYIMEDKMTTDKETLK